MVGEQLQFGERKTIKSKEELEKQLLSLINTMKDLRRTLDEVRCTLASTVEKSWRSIIGAFTGGPNSLDVEIECIFVACL